MTSKPPLKKIVSKNIKFYRKKSRLTQIELAKKSGVTGRYISKLESEPENLTLDTIQSLADSLDIEVATLLGFKTIKGKLYSITDLDGVATQVEQLRNSFLKL